MDKVRLSFKWRDDPDMVIRRAAKAHSCWTATRNGRVVRGWDHGELPEGHTEAIEVGEQYVEHRGGSVPWRGVLRFCLGCSEAAGIVVRLHATFTMRRINDRPIVMVVEEMPGGQKRAQKLSHLMKHSPGGFEWGYGGSGPSDLARSVVGYVMEDPDPDPRLYQAVKRELVAKVGFHGGTISDSSVWASIRRELRRIASEEVEGST